MLENNNTPANKQGGLGSKMDEVLLKTIEDLERQLKDSADLLEASKSSEQMLRASVEPRFEKLAKVRSHIQNSINNEDWSASELEEPFWEELAEMLDLDLKLTEEVFITATLTYSGTLTLPKGYDLFDLDLDADYSFDVVLNGVEVGGITYDSTEFDN